MTEDDELLSGNVSNVERLIGERQRTGRRMLEVLDLVRFCADDLASPEIAEMSTRRRKFAYELLQGRVVGQLTGGES